MSLENTLVVEQSEFQFCGGKQTYVSFSIDGCNHRPWAVLESSPRIYLDRGDNVTCVEMDQLDLYIEGLRALKTAYQLREKANAATPDLCEFAPDRFAQEFFNQADSAGVAPPTFGNGGW